VFERNTEQFELTRRRCKPLHVAHHPTPVEQDYEAVFTAEQRIDLFMNALHVTTRKRSRCHGLELRPQRLTRRC
jgi:hypothetical protein